MSGSFINYTAWNKIMKKQGKKQSTLNGKCCEICFIVTIFIKYTILIYILLRNKLYNEGINSINMKKIKLKVMDKH